MIIWLWPESVCVAWDNNPSHRVGHFDTERVGSQRRDSPRDSRWVLGVNVVKVPSAIESSQYSIKTPGPGR